MLADLLAERLPQVRYSPPDGTYLAWLDCRAARVGESSAGSFFLDRAGVALVDGPGVRAAGRRSRPAQLRHAAAGADHHRRAHGGGRGSRLTARARGERPH